MSNAQPKLTYKNKEKLLEMPIPRKYSTYGNSNYLNLRPPTPSSSSEHSAGSLGSKPTAKELSNFVKSQCELHEIIDKTLKHMCKDESKNNWLTQTNISPEEDLHKYKCKKKEVESVRSDKESERALSENLKIDIPDNSCRTEIINDEEILSHNGNIQTHISDLHHVPVDDVLNFRVIIPVIRKLQRMMVSNLKDEITLMEEMELLPKKVSDVYNSTLYKV